MLAVKLVAVLVVLNVARTLGRWVGPKWSGLVLGLPSTTAVMLVCLTLDHDVAYGVTSAEGAFFGVAAAAVLALVAACALRLRCGFPATLLAAAAAFVASSAALRWLLPAQFAWAASANTVTMLAVAWVAHRLPATSTVVVRSSRPFVASLLVRTVLPLVCVGTVFALAEQLGSFWSGVLGAFPCSLVAMLILANREGGIRRPTKWPKRFR